MALYPQATQKHLSHNYTKVSTTKNAIILHSTASNANSQFGWFNNPAANSSSHFHVALDGKVEQYLDTNYYSWANAQANKRSVTIETAGVQTKDDPWTDAQLHAIIKLVAWIAKTHKIPVRQMNSSAASETGIGWHRLGVDGAFDTSRSPLLRGRNQRGVGESWSSARGKVCPGTNRILQVPEIIAAVKKTNSVVTVVKDKVTNVLSSNKKKSWPDANLPDNASLSTVKATWKKLLKGIGKSGSDASMQTWLKDKKFYTGKIDGKFGSMSVEALQLFLKSKGFYKGKIDGKRGTMSITAEIKYLNDQKQYF